MRRFTTGCYHAGITKRRVRLDAVRAKRGLLPRTFAQGPPHSCRKAAIGSSLDALRAGKYAALSATNTSSPTATAIVSGSCGATPYSRLSTRREAAYARPAPSASPADHEHHGLAQDHRDHPAGPRSQRDAHRDFTAAARDAVREHAVQADRGERERHAPKHHGELRRSPVLRRQGRHLLLDRPRRLDGQPGVHSLDRLAHRRHHRRRSRRRANQEDGALHRRRILPGRHEVARLDVVPQPLRARVPGDAHHLVRRPPGVIARRDPHPDGVPPVEEPPGEGLVDHADPGRAGTVAFQYVAPQKDGDTQRREVARPHHVHRRAVVIVPFRRVPFHFDRGRRIASAEQTQLRKTRALARRESAGTVRAVPTSTLSRRAAS